MNHRGVSHVEVILAFVLFIGFLGFALFFFSPFNNDRVLDSTLYYADDAIAANLTSVIPVYAVVIDPSISDQIITISLSNPANENIRVENNEGARVDGQHNLNRVTINTGSNTGTQRYYTIFINNEFNEAAFMPPGAVQVPNNRYTISSYDERAMVSERNVLSLRTTYDNDYTTLKDQFNLPGRVDFGFELVFDDGTRITAERQLPQGVDVVVQRSRVEVLRTNGAMEFADLLVKVW